LLQRFIRTGDAFTAHPRVDPKLNRLVAFSWRAVPRLWRLDQEMRFLEYDSRGQLVSETNYALETCVCAPHDFLMSDDFYVFLQQPSSMDLLSLIFGAKGNVHPMQ
jgi:carotenoid cleavage dioxygenase-like enzyme